MPLAAPAAPEVEIDGEEIVVTIGPRTYRVLNLEKCTTRGKMQVNVNVSGQKRGAADGRAWGKLLGDTAAVSAQVRSSKLEN